MEINNIPIKEHDKIDSKWDNKLSAIKFEGNPNDYMGVPKYLGIDQNHCASYYIGASWLVQNELAVIVLPKLENIDFIKMFLAALEVDTENESDYFSKCYGIQFDEPLIETDERLNQLTPLLVLHYISLLERLVKHGLKKDYVVREENLKSKVKGRILFSKHLQKNVFQQREDRVFCQFQEYTDDIPENRLLKKALLFAERVINNYSSLRKQIETTDLPNRMAKINVAFQHISDDIEVWQVKKLSSNKLFKEHGQAVKVAKMLLRRFQYSIDNANFERHTTPPFWIDMARLYEMWVYSKLVKASTNKVLFQEKGAYGRQIADFVIKEDKLILDAKYKTDYQKDIWVDIDDIRELSGNARDDRLISDIDDTISPRCIILYPGDNNELQSEKTHKIAEQGRKIPHYRNFYKISIPLPTIKA